MKVNDSTKRYWARTGPNQIFGSDWEVRKDMDNPTAEQRFDQVWSSTLEPAIKAGKFIAVAVAQSMIPNDKRRKFFDTFQEHREVDLAGQKLLAQVDTKADELTQLWHLNAKPLTIPPDHYGTRDSGMRDKNPNSLRTLARDYKIPREELAAALGAAIADVLLRA